ncbi:MAG: alpha/beta hydrolase [Cyanobacteria bacterium P01_A01_bin.105]
MTPDSIDPPIKLNIIDVPAAEPAEQVLVLLHGWGANAQDVAGLADYLQLPKTRMFFPNGPFAHPMTPVGRMWYGFPPSYDFRSPPMFEGQADLQQSRQLLLNWLETLPEQTGIPLEKTILGGFSQGGAMTLDVGPRLPLAGMMVLSGYVHLPEVPKAVSDRPVLVIHGRQDTVVPIGLAGESRSQLQAQGLTVNYQEFDMGHEISLPALQMVGGFCQAQR